MDWSNALAVTFTGIVVVFIALVMLVAIVSLFGFIGSRLNKKKADVKKDAVPPSPSAPSVSVSKAVTAEDDGEIAAIMGAIAAMLASEGSDGGYVIQSITPVKGKRVRKPMPAWAAAGVLDNTAPF